MRRIIAIMLALCLLLPAASLASETDATLSAFGVTVRSAHEEKTGDKQEQAIDYPTFESEDAQLQQMLTDSVTTPILALRKLGQMAQDDAYEDGAKDAIRIRYDAAMDFDNLLSIAAMVSNRPAGEDAYETTLLYRIVDLATRRVLTVGELFEDSSDEVDAAVNEIVYERARTQTAFKEEITSADDMPKPDAYYVCEKSFRAYYAANTVNENAMYVDIAWDELPLTPSALLTPAGEERATDGPVIAVRSTDEAGDESADANADDADAADENADSNADTAEPEATLEPDDTGLDLADVESDEHDAVPAFNDNEAPADGAQPSLDPNFALPPVVTPTPMPLEASDAIIADVLAHGLWKRLGTDGSTYYQFTEDGKLLTVTVSNYSLTEGQLVSDVMSGTVEIGSDSAFTLRAENGDPTGYVLNRAGEAVAPEEFVTPSPSPVPTPTPTPSPSPTPEPTPVPTPTLSPMEVARQQAPSLAPLDDASFEKRNSLPVYSAPEEGSFRDSRAQVTTDESVAIYGVVGDWVLVSYHIGNGSRGRIGYIETVTLNDKDSVAKLQLASVKMTLAKNAAATDDPLNAKTKLFDLKKGDEVTMLAFLGDEWAYVESTYQDKPCRAFIPLSALGEE